MSNLSEHIQLEELGREVWLYKLDLSMFESSPGVPEDSFYWTSGDEGDTVHTATFDGEVYVPFPITVEGFLATDSGPFPRPTIAFSDRSGIFAPLIHYHNDLRGALFTRSRTYAKFLDDGDDPDPEAIFETDTYKIVRKMQHGSEDGVVQFELAAEIDIPGAMIPAQKANKDYCDRLFRVWDPVAGAFDYTNATCGYTGAAYQTILGETTMVAAEDRCAKRWAICRQPEDFTGCPGISRIRKF